MANLWAFSKHRRTRTQKLVPAHAYLLRCLPAAVYVILFEAYALCKLILTNTLVYKHQEVPYTRSLSRASKNVKQQLRSCVIMPTNGGLSWRPLGCDFGWTSPLNLSTPKSSLRWLKPMEV